MLPTGLPYDQRPSLSPFLCSATFLYFRQVDTSEGLTHNYGLSQIF